MCSVRIFSQVDYLKAQYFIQLIRDAQKNIGADINPEQLNIRYSIHEGAHLLVTINKAYLQYKFFMENGQIGFAQQLLEANRNLIYNGVRLGRQYHKQFKKDFVTNITAYFEIKLFRYQIALYMALHLPLHLSESQYDSRWNDLLQQLERIFHAALLEDISNELKEYIIAERKNFEAKRNNQKLLYKVYYVMDRAFSLNLEEKNYEKERVKLKRHIEDLCMLNGAVRKSQAYEMLQLKLAKRHDDFESNINCNNNFGSSSAFIASQLNINIPELLVSENEAMKIKKDIYYKLYSIVKDVPLMRGNLPKVTHYIGYDFDETLVHFDEETSDVTLLHPEKIIEFFTKLPRSCRVDIVTARTGSPEDIARIKAIVAFIEISAGRRIFYNIYFATGRSKNVVLEYIRCHELTHLDKDKMCLVDDKEYHTFLCARTHYANYLVESGSSRYIDELSGFVGINMAEKQSILTASFSIAPTTVINTLGLC